MRSYCDICRMHVREVGALRRLPGSFRGNIILFGCRECRETWRSFR